MIRMIVEVACQLARLLAWGMSTLHVRDVPEDLYGALRQLAEERNSTLSAETIRLLARSLRTDRPETRALLREIESNRPVARGRRRTAAELIREDRDSR